MNILRQLERQIDDKLKTLFSSANRPVEAREIFGIERALLDDLANRAQTLSRGRLVFPYDHIEIALAVDNPERRAALDLVFEPAGLATQIREYLDGEGIEHQQRLTVNVQYIDGPASSLGEHGFHVRCEKRGTPAAAATSASSIPPAVRLSVLTGVSVTPVVELQKARINIGRLPEVLDDTKRVVRRNDVAFSDSPDSPNSTISRAHAYIRYDTQVNEFRLVDEGSAYGTGLLRDGRLPKVPAGARGAKLQAGDEIYIGQARIRFEIAG